MITKFKRLGVAAMICLAAMAQTAGAHMPSDPAATGDIARLSAAANLILQGKVKKVAYHTHRMGGRAMPFAYVTYEVKTRLFGAPAGEITLRFIGGPDGTGGFVAAEGVPTFSPGDEDILFVRSNGEDGCPLVMCEFGRFRILGDTVHDGHGEPVTTLSNGRMRSGGAIPPALRRTVYPAPAFEDVIKNPDVLASIRQMGLSLAQARAKYAREAAKEIVIETFESATDAEGARASARSGLPAPALRKDSVLNAIRGALVNQRRAAPKAIKNADPANVPPQPAPTPVAPK